MEFELLDFGLITDFEGDHLRTALIELAAEQAPLEAPSLRTIAKFARVSCQTLLRWFGSKPLLYRRVLRVMAVTWCHWLELDLMPGGDFAHAHTRLRLAFAELARSDADLALLMDELVAREHSIIARRLSSDDGRRDGRPTEVTRPDHQEPGEPVVEMVHALAASLWSRQCHPISPLSNDEARSRLREFLEHLRWADGSRVVAGAPAPRVA
jgi:hypothetical protein